MIYQKKKIKLKIIFLIKNKDNGELFKLKTKRY